jgi:predicted nuclease of predicted toxin-antitoxin system
VKLLADENFRGAIVRGLLRRRPNLDLVRVTDVGLGEVDDPTILSWAADEGRLVLTHDAATLIGFAYERVAAGNRMPGIIEVRQDLPIGPVIDDLLLIIDASHEGEWDGQVLYLPLQ